MIGTDTLSEVLRSAILSGRVHRSDTAAVSLFLIAPPERGKTSVVITAVGEHGLKLTDVTGIGLLEALQREKNATHVVINDLMSVSGHKHSVKTLTISILNALAEEGTYKIAVPNMSHLDLQGRRVGVIACCTPDQFCDSRTWFQRSGFASRILLLQYDHSPDLTLKILRSIAEDNGKGKREIERHPKFAVPAAPVYVSIPKPMAQKILNITQLIARDHKEVGYRKEKQLRSLACGHALLRTWKNPVVQIQEIDFIEKIIPFIVVKDKVAELR